jgi:hypothetical protein
MAFLPRALQRLRLDDRISWGYIGPSFNSPGNMNGTQEFHNTARGDGCTDGQLTHGMKAPKVLSIPNWADERLSQSYKAMLNSRERRSLKDLN